MTCWFIWSFLPSGIEYEVFVYFRCLFGLISVAQLFVIVKLVDCACFFLLWCFLVLMITGLSEFTIVNCLYWWFGFGCRFTCWNACGMLGLCCGWFGLFCLLWGFVVCCYHCSWFEVSLVCGFCLVWFGLLQGCLYCCVLLLCLLGLMVFTSMIRGWLGSLRLFCVDCCWVWFMGFGIYAALLCCSLLILGYLVSNAAVDALCCCGLVDVCYECLLALLWCSCGFFWLEQ